MCICIDLHSYSKKHKQKLQSSLHCTQTVSYNIREVVNLLAVTKNHALIVRNMLKASLAVLTMTPGSCECQWSSLISFCPWCTNSSCAGTACWSLAELDVVTTSSGSTAKSQTVSRSSAAETASTELSFGFHSSDVTGAVWYRNDTTGVNVELPAWTHEQLTVLPSNVQGLTRHRVSTSMYSLTFHVRCYAVTCTDCQYIGWQWRNFFMSYLCQLFSAML